MDVVITKKGLLESNVIVGTVLLNMYMKCGFLAETLKTALISRLVENRWGKDTFIQHLCMHSEGIYLNVITLFVS